MNIAIIEDDLNYAQQLEKHINKYQERKKVSIQCKHYSNGQLFLDQYQPVWDLIFLDIEMPILNGIDVAKKIRKVNQDVLIIFLTQMAQYAIKGYSVQAFDYILKPIQYYDLEMKLDQIQQLLQTKTNHYLIVNNKTQTIKLNTQAILYIESQNHRLFFHTSKQVYSSTNFESLKKLAIELENYGFVRIHHSFIINLNFVTGYNTNDVFLDEIQLPLSRTYYKNFTLQLIHYWGG